MRKNMNLTGIDTPIGGLSWEFVPSTAIEIKRILLFLDSKRILVAPIVSSFNRWGKQTYEKRAEPDYVALSILEIKNYIAHQQIEKIADDAKAIGLLSEMIQACNVFLDSWETFNNIFVVEKKRSSIILNSSGQNENAEIDAQKYMNIVLHDADVVSHYRKTMQQKVDELTRTFQIDLHIEFPTHFDKNGFKLPN